MTPGIRSRASPTAHNTAIPQIVSLRSVAFRTVQLVSRPFLTFFAVLTAALLAPAGAFAVQPPAPAPDLSAPLLRAAPTAPTTLPTLWGCHPDKLPNPCLDDGETTVLSSTQLQPRKVERVEPAPPKDTPPIDCFYVYGTITAAGGTNAPRHTERALEDLWRWQPARLSRTCRVFAPIYRQVTPVVGIGGSMATGQTRTSAAMNVGYSDLLGAWRDYLAHDNHGRGVLFVGHSQGTAMLVRLLQLEVDRVEAIRQRTVGALLIGGNVTVKRGQRLGGNFAYLPTCSQPGEYGCVVAYSTFTSPPGGTALFGRVSALSRAFGAPFTGNIVPACTNPAELSGDGGVVRPVLRGQPPSGGEGETEATFWNGKRPKADTAWVIPGDHFTARCRVTPHTAALMIQRGANSQLPATAPWADWGLHAREVQLTMGNLERIAQLQSAAWLADHPS